MPLSVHAAALAPGSVPSPSLGSDRHREAEPELSRTGTKERERAGPRKAPGQGLSPVLALLRDPWNPGDSSGHSWQGH